MAEVVGVVSAGIGIAAFVVQITSTIERLKTAYEFNQSKASAELDDIVRRLEVLREILLSLGEIQGPRFVELAINNCQLAYSRAETALQQVVDKLSYLRDRRWRFARHTTEIRDNLKEANLALDRVIRDLQLALLPNYKRIASAKSLRLHPSTLSLFVPHDAKKLGSLLGLGCTATRYRWSLQFALSKYGVPFKVHTTLEFIAQAGMYSLRPALSVERVVRYTSSGFESLWLFKQGYISLSDAQERFRELAKCDGSLKYHINPGGRNYVQELLSGPAVGQHQQNQFELLRSLVCELGMKLDYLDQKFLVRCARWIGEGWHIYLLETILEHGFDPGCSDSPIYEEWPSTCSPSWSSEEVTPDPFFIEYLAILTKACPGFAGSTPLHDMVLQNNRDAVASLLSRSQLHTQKNFLGQTPLHLAVGNPDVVELLVQAGHDMDVTDKQGNTPLMYASATGNISTVQLLLSKGADPFLEDSKLERDFMEYAAVRGQWRLVINALATIRTHYPQEDFDYFVDWALTLLIAHTVGRDDVWSNVMANLVSLTSDCNTLFGDYHRGAQGNTLLHYVTNRDDAEVLVQHGFRSFNLANSKGQTAMYSLAPNLDAQLTQFLLDHGTDLNRVDQQGHTILFNLSRRLSYMGYKVWDALDSIRICLSEGLDVFLSDDCRCPCSPGGCFLPAVFDIAFRDYIMRGKPSFVWGMEFLSIMEELKGLDDSKRVLLGFLGSRIPGSDSYSRKSIAEDEIDEILDEEREFIAELEKEMLLAASKPMECLRSEWMVMLRDKYKEEYEKRKQNSDGQKASERPPYKVDYKNDTYKICYRGHTPSSPPITKYMAEYIIWLEHQYNRSEASGEAETQRRAWYERRLAWFTELMEVMEVDAQTLAKELEYYIQRGSWEEPNIPDRKRIVRHFLTSVKSQKSAKDGS
ncbi:hypothetical protein BJY00DRAFT_317017 [Aspergillus carlsbadensis]|nr:hypothetical protein BJY00DRAFT_317017 [Aspergillus carlsbadensis]